MKDYMKIYQEWLSNPYFDEDTKAELRAIEGDENEIKERFYMDLEFGTAGLRGVIGAGINRMNIYVVRRATQGLANYIIKQGGADKGVAIAYDSRHMSPEFAMEAAMTLAANGIKAYKFESLRPTPELSFAVRELGCIAGINITASHNPPEYNGYKVYWEDGAQFTPPHDKGVTEEVMAITDLSTVRTTDAQSARTSGNYQIIGREIDDKYIAQVKAQVVNQGAIDKMQDQITIVYTPLHGTGNIPARRVMKELGFTHVFQVEFTADMIHKEMVRQMENAEEKPVISSFCPAIVRLIQVRFPALVDNILLVKAPVNASATYYHKILEGQGVPSEEIGIFYVTPCAAKIAALKGAEGYSSTIKGVINMDTLYNKVYKQQRQ